MSASTVLLPKIIKKINGKGIGWNDEEMLALAQAAPVVCEDPSIGKQMTRRTLGERLRENMIKSSLRPNDACTRNGTKDHRDERRWEGRSAEACLRKWYTMRADCTTMFSIKRRLCSLNLTGNFTEEDFKRMALLEFSKGKQVLGHLYDCGNNKDYNFVDKFEYGSVYDYLSTRTSLVSGGSFVENESVSRDSNGVMERPIGNKEAKKRKMEGKGISKSSMENKRALERVHMIYQIVWRRHKNNF